MTSFGLEVDVQAVGGNSDSGDCFIIRFGNLQGHRSEWKLILVDGGFADDGTAAIDFIRSHYVNHGNRIDLVVSTHADSDHINGIKSVMEDESIEIGELWMHTPWYHNESLQAALSGDPNATNAAQLTDKQRTSLTTAQQVEVLAHERFIPLVEPFTGMTFGNDAGQIVVLGPSEMFYESIVEDLSDGDLTTNLFESMLSSFRKSAAAVATRLLECWSIETLNDPKDKVISPRNCSSVILLIEANTGSDHTPKTTRVLLTADAELLSLVQAVDYAEHIGVDLRQCDAQQVPHHGSRKNVGPTILNSLIGPRKRFDDGKSHMNVIVSSAKDNPEKKHPNPRVTNAYWRRGAKVFTTAGLSKRFYYGTCPYRDGSPATSFPFYDGPVETGDDE